MNILFILEGIVLTAAEVRELVAVDAALYWDIMYAREAATSTLDVFA